MFPEMPSENPRPPAGVDRYLGPGERLIYSTRRHAVVLGSAVTVWLVTVALGLAVGLSFSAGGGSRLSWVGAVIILAGSLYLAVEAWRWRVARYVLTSDRVLLVEGILSLRVNGLPLRSVLDTTYQRSLAGRLLGYGDLEVNLSGQPGLRKLTSLPRPDGLYHLILSLTSVRDAGGPPVWPALALAPRTEIVRARLQEQLPA